MDEEFLLPDHESFNKDYYDFALNRALLYAEDYGLAYEVELMYNRFIHAAFNTNDYPVNLEDYDALASEALYEWDI